MTWTKVSPSMKDRIYNGEAIVSTDSTTVLLFEIVDQDGFAIWGGNDEGTAIYWLTRKAPPGSKLYVSQWEDDGLDSWATSPMLDLTPLVTACLGRDW